MATIRINEKKRPGWIIDYYDFRGDRKRKVVQCTKQEAELIAKEIDTKKMRFQLGFDKTVGENLLFTKAIAHYFSRSAKAEKTEERERRVYKPFIKFMGNLRIRDINQSSILKFFKHRKENDKIADATLGIEYRTLRAFFNFFVENKFLAESPMKGLKPPKVKEKEIRFLTLKEINSLLSVIDDNNYRDLVLMYIYTGARRLEILKETFIWENVDFDNHSISILGKGNKIRIIPMTDITYEILYRRKHIENRSFPFDLHYEAIFPRIKKYYVKANIKNANIHTLRKTFGSLLVQQEVNIYTVSKLMGHSSVVVTEKHYASLIDKNLRAGSKKDNWIG